MTIPEMLYPNVQSLWPLVSPVAARNKLEPTFLLSVAYVCSQLDTRKVSEAGARGLMQMSETTAAVVAGKKGVSKWDLLDPETALDFGAFYLAEQLARFTLPRVAAAAYYAGPGAVKRAGDQVPPVRNVERFARNVMETWTWLRTNIDNVLTRPVETPVGKNWRLIVPPDNWQSPIAMPAGALQVVEEAAERLQLVFHKDEAQRKAYLGTTKAPAEKPPKSGELIVPTPGATRANNGAYESDSGIDIMMPFGSPVLAAASGTIVYSEPGHTPWNQGNDTANSILILLDNPFDYKRKKYPFLWYTHLCWLRYLVRDGAKGRHVEQGELVGRVGRGNGVSHLHMGVVADRAQTEFVGPFQLAAYFGWMGGGGR